MREMIFTALQPAGVGAKAGHGGGRRLRRGRLPLFGEMRFQTLHQLGREDALLQQAAFHFGADLRLVLQDSAVGITYFMPCALRA